MSYEININAREEYENNRKQFDVMPKGEYVVIMSNYESKTGKTSGNEYIQATFDVVEGEYKNRKIFKNYFIFGSEKATAIARGELSAIGISVGVEIIKNLDQLLNKPFIGKVDIEEGQNGYSDKNVIKGAKPYKVVGQLAKPIETKPKPESSPQKKNSESTFEDDII